MYVEQAAHALGRRRTDALRLTGIYFLIKEPAVRAAKAMRRRARQCNAAVKRQVRRLRD